MSRLPSDDGRPTPMSGLRAAAAREWQFPLLRPAINQTMSNNKTPSRSDQGARSRSAFSAFRAPDGVQQAVPPDDATTQARQDAIRRVATELTADVRDFAASEIADYPEFVYVIELGRDGECRLGGPAYLVERQTGTLHCVATNTHPKHTCRDIRAKIAAERA